MIPVLGSSLKVYLVYMQKCGVWELLCFTCKIQTSGNSKVLCATPSSLSVSDLFRAYVMVYYLLCAFSFEIYFGTGQSKIRRPVCIVLWV